jgi:hypothetical protein
VGHIYPDGLVDRHASPHWRHWRDVVHADGFVCIVIVWGTALMGLGWLQPDGRLLNSTPGSQRPWKREVRVGVADTATTNHVSRIAVHHSSSREERSPCIRREEKRPGARPAWVGWWRGHAPTHG